VLENYLPIVVFILLGIAIRNEHTNGLLRQHLLKQRVFDNLSQKQVNKALALLSNRPRKSLDCQTSKVAFELDTIQPKKSCI
jgi:IS30 family transposase